MITMGMIMAGDHAQQVDTMGQINRDHIILIVDSNSLTPLLVLKKLAFQVFNSLK